MREKIYNVLNKIYGAILMASFFAGFLPLIPFIIALIIGGPTGEAISIFLYKGYYPYVIAASAISVLVGWIAMYVGKKEGFSIKKKKKTSEDKSENTDQKEMATENKAENSDSKAEDK